MTLQQLRYADGIARFGSYNEAARRLFVSQPTLTAAIQQLEEELRTAVFTRSGKGAILTREGEEFMASARQVLDDVDRISAKYAGAPIRLPQFAISCQHYAFAVEAFTEVVRECTAEEYDFTLRETVTSEVIEDVAFRKSEIGILYLSNRNANSLGKIFRRHELVFEELFVSRPHVFLGKLHPLARSKRIKPSELDAYPYISYEQGEQNALYFSEEIMPSIDRKRNIRVRDRGTMTNLILELNGYTIASSGLSKKLNGPDIVKIPLATSETIRVGLLRRKEGLSPTGERFAAALDRVLKS